MKTSRDSSRGPVTAFQWVLVVIACSAGLLGCAAAPSGEAPGAGRFEFAVIGDTPYDGRQEKQFPNVMREIDAADLAFVAHVGDFQWDGAGWNEKAGGMAPCSDETYADRLRLAQGSRHPFIFTPGDNDWTDCHRAKPRAYEPLERLAKLRQLFFPGDDSLGRRTLRLARQSENPAYAMYRENARWVHGNVLFVTLHTVGSNNNLGRTPEMDAEHAERTAANVAWLRQAFAAAKRGGHLGIVIITQANPAFENNWTAVQQSRYLLSGLRLKPPAAKRTTGFDGLLEALEEEVVGYDKPVAYVHGDTHMFRIDKPLVSSVSRRAIEHFTRVEVFGYPDSHWIRVTVDPRDPGLFSFRPQFVRENRVTHQ